MSDNEVLRAQAASLGVALDPSQASRLIRFEELLADRGIPQGVVSASDIMYGCVKSIDGRDFTYKFVINRVSGEMTETFEVGKG